MTCFSGGSLFCGEVFNVIKQPGSSICPAFECYRLNSSSFPGNLPAPPHMHYFCELLLLREGRCLVERDGIAHHLLPGEAIYISPLATHSASPESSEPVVLDVLKFSATRLKEIPGYLADLRVLAMDAGNLHLPIHLSAEDVSRHYLDNFVRECILENERRAFAYDLRIRALIYLVITALARIWLDKQVTLIEDAGDRTDSVLNLPSYIEQHISEPLKVEDLAAMLGLSYPRFSKQFRDFFGVGCKQFIERIRMDYVEQYLIYSDLDLDDISQLTGFTDSSHMVKCFRRLRNMTPGQFRSTSRENGLPPNFPVSLSSASK